MSQNLQQLAEALHLEFQSAPDLAVKAVATPESATGEDLCFMYQKRFLGDINASECGVVILPTELSQAVKGKALLISDNPQFSYVIAIKALGLEPPVSANGSIHRRLRLRTAPASAKALPSRRLS